jgi:hypothetical protein
VAQDDFERSDLAGVPPSTGGVTSGPDLAQDGNTWEHAGDFQKRRNMHEAIEATLKAVIGAADAVLSRKSKIEAAIVAEVGALSALIEDRLTTDAEFRRLECQAAIGEPAAGLEEARKAAADARGAVEQASLRLGGLRDNLGAIGGELVTRYEAVKAEIPAHEAVLIKVFTVQWNAAREQFAATLGHRAALEKLIGRPLPLPEPAASAPPDLSEAGIPHARRSDLESAIETIGRMKDAAEGRRNIYTMPGQTLTPYDPNSIYVLTDGRYGLPVGTKVIDASFDAGTLDRLAAVDAARIFKSIEVVPGVLAADKKNREIEKTRRQKEYDDSETRLRSGDVGAQTTRRHDLEKLNEINYGGLENDEKRKRDEAAAAARVPIQTTSGHDNTPTTGFPL